MRTCAHAGSDDEKELWQTCLILAINCAMRLPKLRALESDCVGDSEIVVHLLEYKGCALAIWDAADQVWFSRGCESASITSPTPQKWRAHTQFHNSARRDHLAAPWHLPKSSKTETGLEPISTLVWQDIAEERGRRLGRKGRKSGGAGGDLVREASRSPLNHPPRLSDGE